jgi:hypothetical protein
VAHSETVLIDTRLKPTLESKNYTGYAMCDEHAEQIKAGYIALVEVSNTEPVHMLNDAQRTGQIAMVRREVWDKLFDMPVPPQNLAFVEQGVVAMLQQRVEKSNGQ